MADLRNAVSVSSACADVLPRRILNSSIARQAHRIGSKGATGPTMQIDSCEKHAKRSRTRTRTYSPLQHPL